MINYKKLAAYITVAVLGVYTGNIALVTVGTQLANEVTGSQPVEGSVSE